VLHPPEPNAVQREGGCTPVLCSRTPHVPRSRSLAPHGLRDIVT